MTWVEELKETQKLFGVPFVYLTNKGTPICPPIRTYDELKDKKEEEKNSPKK